MRGMIESSSAVIPSGGNCIVSFSNGDSFLVASSEEGRSLIGGRLCRKETSEKEAVSLYRKAKAFFDGNFWADCLAVFFVPLPRRF